MAGRRPPSGQLGKLVSWQPDNQAATQVGNTITQNRCVRTLAPPLVMFGCFIVRRPDCIRRFSGGSGRRDRLQPGHLGGDPAGH